MTFFHSHFGWLFFNHFFSFTLHIAMESNKIKKEFYMNNEMFQNLHLSFEMRIGIEQRKK